MYVPCTNTSAPVRGAAAIHRHAASLALNVLHSAGLRGGSAVRSRCGRGEEPAPIRAAERRAWLLKMDQELRRIPVVLFSSADENDVHWRAAGADAFLQKPFDVRALPALVRRQIESDT